MHVDARGLADGQVVECEVCIVGAGPAGTVCAREFLDSGMRVALLESGGFGNERRIQALSAGTLEGHLEEPVEDTHLRQVGGTANHWIIKMADKRYGYRFAPLDAIDFEARPGMPNSGWPIRRADLDPYYARVHEVCGVGPFDYGADRWSSAEAQPLALAGDAVESAAFMFSPTAVFTQEIPAAIGRSENVDLYTHATVVELRCSPDGRRVTQAVVRHFDGRTVLFSARTFILTCNAVQTPRLLLASRGVHPKGIGNTHDVVGRYYVDHALLPCGNFYPHDPRMINGLAFYDMRLIEGASVLGRVSLTAQTMRREQLPNLSATIFPMPDFSDVDALVSVKELAQAMVDREWPKDIGAHLAKLWAGRRHLLRVAYEKARYDTPIMPGFGRGGWSRLGNNERKYRRLELLALGEQLPEWDNRVTLTDERDELGMPQVKVRYRWSADNLQAFRRSIDILGRAFEGTGLGRYEPADPLTLDNPPTVFLHHMACTTRMHDDPRQGVVDRHGRVHEMANLYIGGSAAFTTAGYANPTLTNLALTTRVADEVKAVLQARMAA